MTATEPGGRRPKRKRAMQQFCAKLPAGAPQRSGAAAQPAPGSQPVTTAHRMVLSVRSRIHCGIGRFCFCFLPKMRLILKDLCDGWQGARRA